MVMQTLLMEMPGACKSWCHSAAVFDAIEALNEDQGVLCSIALARPLDLAIDDPEALVAAATPVADTIEAVLGLDAS